MADTSDSMTLSVRRGFIASFLGKAATGDSMGCWRIKLGTNIFGSADSGMLPSNEGGVLNDRSSNPAQKRSADNEQANACAKELLRN